jgi:WD40 repeat protein
MEINTAWFSWDNQKMACTSADKAFSIWNIDSGRPIFFWCNSAAIWDGVFTPADSSLFAFVDGKSLSIYGTTRKVMIFQVTETWPKAMVFSRNGNRIAVHADISANIVDLYKNDTEAGPELSRFEVCRPMRMAFCPMMPKLDTGSLSSMALSPDDLILAFTADMGAVNFWDIEREKTIGARVSIGNAWEMDVKAISFSPCGIQLVLDDLNQTYSQSHTSKGYTEQL